MKASDNTYLNVFVITVREQAILKEELDNFEGYSIRNGIKSNIIIAKHFNYEIFFLKHTTSK